MRPSSESTVVDDDDDDARAALRDRHVTKRCTCDDDARRAKGNPVPIPEPGAEPSLIRALVREFVGATQKDPETPSGDPGRVFFSA